MLRPSGVGVDRHDLGAGALQGPRAGLPGRALGAVEHDLEPDERVVDGADQVGDVVVDRPLVRPDPAHLAAPRPFPRLVQPALDRDLDRVVELEAAAGEELDAVVGHRVVGGGEHHAEVGAEGAGEVGDARRRQHAEQQHVDAGRGEARHDGGLQELARDPGVATDDGERAVPLEVAAVGQDVRRGDGQVQGQLSGEVTVGQAPDPVGAEESGRHASDPSRNRQRLLH